MKIEICEQLCASWLKHVEGCQIVQTNWKPSPRFMSMDKSRMAAYNEFISAIKDAVKGDGLDIFKKSNENQFISQCEIDVIGIHIKDAVIDKLYMVDSAFHESGVGYKEAVATVAKKILRAVVVSDLIFNGLPPEIIFASPKCRTKLMGRILDTINKLDGIIKSFYPGTIVSILFNNDFTTRIYRPVVGVADSVSDDNDLFLRGVQLTNVCEAPPSTKTPKGENKATVFKVFNDLNFLGLLTGTLLAELRTSAYTKNKFDISSFPMLISVADLAARGRDNNRFYPDEIDIGGVKYRVCNQWTPANINKLQSWYEDIIDNA